MEREQAIKLCRRYLSQEIASKGSTTSQKTRCMPKLVPTHTNMQCYSGSRVGRGCEDQEQSDWP